jgi:hypothetical protein
MDEERRQEPKGRLERKGTGFLQRSQSGETRAKASSTRGRLKARLFLREDGGSQEEEYVRKDRQRPKLENN